MQFLLILVIAGVAEFWGAIEPTYTIKHEFPEFRHEISDALFVLQDRF